MEYFFINLNITFTITVFSFKMMMRQYRRPFLLLNMLFVLMTFSGKFAIGFYAVEVFHDANSGLNEYFSAIVVGEFWADTTV